MGIGDVVEIGRRREHPLAQVVAHSVGGPPEHPGGGGLRDPGCPGDVCQGGPASLHRMTRDLRVMQPVSKPVTAAWFPSHGGLSVAERHIRIAMNGVTGRMGRTQHLERSIITIRRQGGVELPTGDRVVPEPVLVGRNPERLEALAAEFGLDEWTTDVEAVLADPDIDIYFDAQLTSLRAEAVAAAIEAGKAVYCEKPLAEDSATARDLLRRAESAGVAHGIVQDKLFLPGLLALRRLLDSDFFGRILTVKGDFGYWVFEGD